MTVTLIRVLDEPELLRWHAARGASWAADFDALPIDPIKDFRPLLAGPVNGHDCELWLGSVGDDDVATIDLRLPLHENGDLLNLSLHIHPAHRSRGHGREALEAALARTRELGRRKVLFEVPQRTRDHNPSPAEGLVASIGARPMLVEIRRLLDLGAVSAERLADLESEAEAASAGYSIATWGDRAPEADLADVAELQGLMSTDPPQGELELAPERWSGERYRERERSVIERGRVHIAAAARDDRTGRLVGFSDLGVPRDEPVGYQWETVVRAEHRGHRLGLRLKVAALRQLIEQLPYVTHVNTWNAEVNTHMIAVNEALGYRPMEAWAEWQLDL